MSSSVQLLDLWMLWGIAALSVPLIIHLLTRHTPRTVQFPTLRFLLRALARQSRLMRLRHLIVLLLRLLVIAALVAAFTRPVLKLPFQKAIAKEGETATVIAIDVSLSMGYTGSGTTPLSRAKAEAVKILQSLHDRDRANVLLVSASTVAAAPQVTRDFGMLRDEVEGAQPTMEEADFNAAIERALAELARSEAPVLQRELYLVSDFQRSNWAAVSLDAVPADVNLYLIDVDTGQKRNLAITQVRTRPSTPRVGDVAEMSCEVANYSPEPREIPVGLELTGGRDSAGLRPEAPEGGVGAGGSRGGALRLEQRVLAPAFGSATAVFRLPAEGVGDREAVLRIPPDALPADDVRYLDLSVRKGLSVYLLTDEDPRDDGTSAFYLVRAMAPSPAVGTSLRVTVLDGRQAAGRSLRGADVIFISNLDDVDESLAESLCDYMTNGGSVFYLVGGGQVEPQLAALNRANSGGPVAPFAVAELLDLKDMGRGYVTWRQARFESPMLKLFRDPEYGNLSDLRFYKFRLVTKTSDRAEVLLRYEDGTVAAARSRVGAGSFVLCNFSPHPLFSDMMKHELFPPLLHELIKGALWEEAAPQDFLVGRIASVAVGAAPKTAAPSLVFLDPQGRRIEAKWQQVGDSLSILFEHTPQPGFYRVQTNGRAAAAVAVNVSPRESDLRDLNGEELAAKQRMERRSYTVQADVDPTHVERLRRGRDLWHLFLMGALAAALLEQTAAHWLRTR